MTLHGIERHSPSSLNAYAAQPALYVLERIFGKRGPPSCAMHRGTAIETGIVHGLLHPDVTVKECQDIATAQFDQLAALSGDPKRDKEREAVPGIVEQGLIALLPYGVPDEVQLQVWHEIPGLKLPIMGFVDIGWTQHGIRLDIKSQLRLSSEISPAHNRQVGCYLHASNMAGRVAYLTPSKHGVYEVENPTQHMRDLIEIARRVERFLSLSTDPAELAALVVPDYSSFFWNDPITRTHGRAVFGF